MSKENSSLKSFFTWSLILTLILLAGLFVVKWSVISQAANVNLASITTVKDWRQKSKDLSQIICQESVQPAVPPVNDNQSVVIDAARRAYFAGDCESALAYWTLAVEQDPRNETAAIMRFFSSGLDREMLPRGMPVEDMAEFLIDLGSLAEQNKKNETADYWYTHAFDLQPSRAAATRIISYREGAAEKKQVWQRLSETLAENDADYWWALGQQAELDEQWQQAIEAYSTGAGISTDPYSFLMRQGSLLLRLDRLIEAEDVFIEAASLQPNRRQPYLQLGGIYSDIGDYDTAKIWYERAVEVDPGEYRTNYLLGLTYYHLEDHDLAEHYFSKAVEIDYQNSLALYYLAQSIYQNGRPERALAYLEDAVSFDEGRNGDWLVALGDWREAANDEKGALEAYYRALELEPDQAEIADKIKKIESE